MAEERQKHLNVGGQAVIEGVMMRSPTKIATAVRTPSGRIAVKEEEYRSLITRRKFLSIPIIRGAVVLVETVTLAMKALSYSADQATTEESVDEEKKGSISTIHLIGMIVFSLAAGFALFFYLPLFITERTGLESGVLFNLVDGLIRLIVLFLYIVLITRWKEMRRIFEYHGAEHKAIFAYEIEGVVSSKAAMKYPTVHPRCSTSFLLLVVIVSVIIFIILGKPHTITDRVVRFSFVPVIGGISYELLKLSAKPSLKRYFSVLVWPGLFLQHFTTKEPSVDQLEVAVAALDACLKKG